MYTYYSATAGKIIEFFDTHNFKKVDSIKVVDKKFNKVKYDSKKSHIYVLELWNTIKVIDLKKKEVISKLKFGSDTQMWILEQNDDYIFVGHYSDNYDNKNSMNSYVEIIAKSNYECIDKVTVQRDMIYGNLFPTDEGFSLIYSDKQINYNITTKDKSENTILTKDEVIDFENNLCASIKENSIIVKNYEKNTILLEYKMNDDIINFKYDPSLKKIGIISKNEFEIISLSLT